MDPIIPPHLDPMTTRYDPPYGVPAVRVSPPPPAVVAELVRPPVNWDRWIHLAVSLLLGWLAGYGIRPAPVPPDLSPLSARLERLEAGQAAVMRAAGVPAPHQ